MRNVIITGGSKGIGLAVARKLSSEYRCIAIARHPSDALSHAIEEVGQALQFQSFDLNCISEIPNLVKSIRKELGPIYGLVNNAAIGTSGILANTPNAAIENTIRLNTVSPIVLSKYVVRSMMAGGGGGRIVNIASIVGFTGFSGLSVYGASKASIVGFTKALARELGGLNINVNAIAPGFVDSDMTQGLHDDQRDQIVRRSPLRRLADVEDVANAAAFLFSDSARNITGTVLTVDAGSTA